MKLVYPAIFYQHDGEDGYTVVVPDLQGCVTEGKTLADAISMGIDAASGWVLDELEDNKPVPKASKSETIKPDKGGFVSLLVLDMDLYIEKREMLNEYNISEKLEIQTVVFIEIEKI